MDKESVTDAWDNKGDIMIGNDVWIGYEAVNLSGVTIGDGAITPWNPCDVLYTVYRNAGEVHLDENKASWVSFSIVG